MRTKLLFTLLCVLVPAISNAEIIYRVEQIDMPQTEPVSSNNRHALSNIYYIGASYNYTMWQDYTTDTNVYLDGKNTSSFDIVAGLRLYDTFRIEAISGLSPNI